jgi:hypothetical protein
MKFHPILASAVVLAFCVSLAPAVHAQSTRIWVSGVGDDGNPGSRTAPVKSYAGAISKTAERGEINSMDPGGFGAVSISKSITIDGGGTYSGISTASGQTGVIITAEDGDVVTLRNLVINGMGTGGTGIRISSGGMVRIENCIISGGITNGINFIPSTPNAALYIKNTHIYNCGGSAVVIKPTANARVFIEDCQLEQTLMGISVENSAKVVIKDSAISQNTGAGVNAAAVGAVVTIEDSAVALNGTGIEAAGAVTISGVTVTGNSGAGLLAAPGGSIKTYHNNQISGNNPDGNPTGSLPLR